MTRESSDPRSSDQWRTELAQGFEALLGRPLSGYPSDAVYAACFGGNLISELRFDRDPAWVEAAALSASETVSFDSLFLYNFMDDELLRFDASQSLFEFDDSSGLPAGFLSDLAAASMSDPGFVVRGRDLAVLVERHGVDLGSPDLAGTWYVCDARIASDGTLIDALRVATGIGDGPESLADFDGQIDEAWETALAAVTDPRLRSHLRLGCETYFGSGEGLIYLGDKSPSGDEAVLPDGDCTLIACWDEAENQREVRVVQLSKNVA
ncbi:hypothetical protein [Streptomyces europaeiscabiei]|uniref:hypothetical protein n=1 Tax=Streptomyces europaeiscabiei TaxID=146819 RepID=UPI0038F63082